MLSEERTDVIVTTDTPTPAGIVIKTDDFTLTTLPVEIGELSESMALTGKRRAHHSENDTELELELSNKIPFGAEPEILRKVRISEGLATVTMDMVMRASCALTTLSAGGILVEAKDIRTIKILEFSQNGCTVSPFSKHEFSSYNANNGVIYEGSMPPLGITLETDSARFDWMPGDDLWRWTNGTRIGGTSTFTITRINDSIQFKWTLFIKKPVCKDEEDVPVPGRNWRLTWAAAWKKIPVPSQTSYPKSFDVAVYKWPASVRLAEKNTPRGCFCADATLAILKKWIRTSLDGVTEGETLAVKNIIPLLCTNAGHLDRANKIKLQHWDMMSVLEFRRWANRILAKRGAALKIQTPEDSPFRGFMQME